MSMVPSVRDLFSGFDDVFSPAFNEFIGGSKVPKVDIKETDEAFELIADMPGCTKEEVIVEYQHNYLTLSANHESHKEETENEGNYLRKERQLIFYNRSFYIPNVDEKKISGEFKDGVLKLSLPKSDKQNPEAVRIALN